MNSAGTKILAEFSALIYLYRPTTGLERERETPLMAVMKTFSSFGLRTIVNALPK
jgi:hypothetical protein